MTFILRLSRKARTKVLRFSCYIYRQTFRPKHVPTASAKGERCVT